MPALDAGTGHHWQGLGLGDASGAHFGQYRVEPVVRVSLKVERHVHCRDQFVLKFPWPIADNPARVRVLG